MRDHRTSRFHRRDLIARAAAVGLVLPGLAQGPAGVRRAAAAPARVLAADPTTLTIALNGSPSDLDPHSAYDYRSAFPLRGPYEQLVALKGSSTTEMEGKIAESWSANADKSVWTFKIRPGVVFQDGTPCDAEAVRASFERFVTMGLGPAAAMARFIQDAKQITAPDPNTLVMDCGRPQPLLIDYLTSQYGPLVINTKAVLAQDQGGDQGHTWAMTNAKGLGTGPYEIVEFLPEERVVLKRHEAFWGGWEGSHFQQVVIRVVPEDGTRRQLVESGEVDVVDNLTPEALAALEQNPDIHVDRSFSAEVDYMMMTVHGPLETPEARQALCWSFPYDDVVQGVYKGYAKPAKGGVAELLNGFNPKTPTYTTDLDKAKALLAKAGVAEGTTIGLTQESGDENVKSAVQLWQANLAKIGVTLDVTTVDLTTFTSIVFGDAPVEERPLVMPWFWWPDFNDALNHLWAQISCDAWGSKGTNGGFYCNKEVEQLMTDAFATADPATYRDKLDRVQTIISAEDPPAVYYMQRQWTTILRHDVQGFVFNPINIGTLDFWRLSRAG